jgi:hypothetical protein
MNLSVHPAQTLCRQIKPPGNIRGILKYISGIFVFDNNHSNADQKGWQGHCRGCGVRDRSSRTARCSIRILKRAMAGIFALNSLKTEYQLRQ